MFREHFGPLVILICIVYAAIEFWGVSNYLDAQAAETKRQVVDVSLYTVQTFQVDPGEGGGPCDDGTMGHGISFGPRHARQSLMVYSCPDGPILETTQHGEPENDHQLDGPPTDEVVVDLAPNEVFDFLVGQLIGPACKVECLVVNE